MNKIKLCKILSVVAVIVILTVITIVSDDVTKYTIAENENVSSKKIQENISFTGIISGSDTNEKVFNIRSINSGIDTKYSYKGSTSIKSKYDKELSGGQVKIGDIFEIEYNIKNNDRFITSMKMSEDMWEYTDIKKFNLNGGNISIGDEEFEFAYNILVSEKNELVDRNKVSEEDIIDIKGIDNKIYTVIINQRHATLEMINYSEYIGGTLLIDYDNGVDITKDLVVDCKAGKHMIIMSKDNMRAEIEVTAENGKNHIIDMSKSDVTVQKYGKVTFEILPETARVYIDGKIYDSNNDITLLYGKHTLNIELSGYKSYVTTIDINEKETIIKAELTKEETDSNDSETSKEEVDSNESKTSKEETEEDNEIEDKETEEDNEIEEDKETEDNNE